MDIDVSEALFTDPVAHAFGQASLDPGANATATLTYGW